MMTNQGEPHTSTIQFNWDVLPVTRLEESQIVAPLGCLYSPFSSEMGAIPHTTNLPIACLSCKTYLNPFIKLDRKNGMWWCPFCEKRSYLPDHLSIPESIKSVNDWPIEMRETSRTIDYHLPKDITSPTNDNIPLVYYFVIDTYQQFADSSFKSLIKSIIQTLHKLPSGSLIGLMTFNKSVQIHNMVKNEMIDVSMGDVLTSTSYTQLFQKETVSCLLTKLNLLSRDMDSNENKLLDAGYLIEPNPSSIGFITDYINNLNGLYTDSFKPPRCTGFAHYVYSIMFSQLGFRNFMGKVLFFTSGPCTEFPGKIVGEKDQMRTHRDIYALEADDFTASSKYYTLLSYIACGQSVKKSLEIYKSSSLKTTKYDIDPIAPVWSVNLIVGSLDQVGAYEMKPLIGNSSGTIYLLETFDSYLLPQMISSCIDSTKRNVTLEVSTSNGLKTSKLISNGNYALPSSYHRASKFHHLYHDKIDDELGEFDSPQFKCGFTNKWKFNELAHDDTLSLFFKMETKRSSSELTNSSISQVFIQFKIKYWDSEERKWILRITTIRKPTTLAYLNIDSNRKSEIYKDHKFLLGFNQKVWVVLLARLIINKIDTNLGYSSFDKVVHLIDRTMVKLLYHFGGISVNLNQPQSSNPYYRLQTMYEINENFKALPSLIYNLRRNLNLIKIFNSSPDETAFYHLWFLRMNSELSLIVIEPVLCNVEGEKVTRLPLDSSCLESTKNTSFLVLDSGFLLLLYYQYSQNDKLPLHPSNNDTMIEDRNELLPWKFISDLLEDRKIVPKIVVTQRNHSQERFLLSRLSPVKEDLPNMDQLDINKSSSYLSFLKPSKRKMKVISDDITLKQYYDNLVKQVKNYHV